VRWRGDVPDARAFERAAVVMQGETTRRDSLAVVHGEQALAMRPVVSAGDPTKIARWTLRVCSA
jgi:hypothetical protein